MLINTLQNPDRLPVIAFIERDADEEVSTIEERYKEIYNPGGVLFYVPTLPNDPLPAISYFESKEYFAIQRLENKTEPKLDEGDLGAIEEVFGREKAEVALEIATDDFSLKFLPYLKRETHKRIKTETENNWIDLSRLLSEMGVKTVIVRGRNYIESNQTVGLTSVDERFIELKRTNSGKIPGGCVGELCKRLALSNFDIRLSTLTYPERANMRMRRGLKS